MSSSDPRIKPIKIKTGVVKRLGKEMIAYSKEAEQQKKKIQQLKEQGKDDHDIRKQEEVLMESEMMIPDCERRLIAAWEELNMMVDSEQDLNATEEYKAALQVLEDNRQSALKT